MDIEYRSTNTPTTTRNNTSTNINTTIYASPTTRIWFQSLNNLKSAKIASSNNNSNRNNTQEQPHHNEVTDLTNIPTSPEIDDTDPRNENPYTVRRERTETRHLLRGRRRASLSFPTQDSTLVSYDSTDIESNIIRPIEAGQSEPPSRTGTPTGTPTRTPTLHNFNISSPSDHSSVNTIPTPTSSELRANPFLPPTFQQRQDFNFVQDNFRVQPILSPHSSIWSATSPQNTISTNTTPNRSQQSSSSNTSISVPRVEVTNSLQPPRNTILSPSSFIPELRLASSHPGRTRATSVLNPNPPTLSRTNDHTYLFPLDHKTWNPPPPLYGPTNLGDTLTNWSRNRLTNTLNLTHRQRNSALEVLATPSLELKFNTTIKYDTIFNHPFHATTPSIVTTTTPAPFICIDFVYKFDRYTKQTLGFATFYNPHTGLSYTCRFN